MPSDDPRERRVHIRIPVGVIVRVDSDNKSRRFYSRDLSAGGIFLLAEDPLAEETRVDVELYLPQISTPVRAKGEVVWIQRHEPTGFAVRFIEISETAQELIRWVIGRYFGEGP